jgi:hypothetical protein
MTLDDKTPLGITQRYDPTTNTTEVSFCYVENSDIEYFILEYWDENKRAWVPYDGRHGIIKRQDR